jgi:hypothetical protein
MANPVRDAVNRIIDEREEPKQIMPVPTPGDMLEVVVTKISIGKDDKLYVTVKHPGASNNPTLIWGR